MLESICGRRVPLVLSDDPASAKRIAEFRDSDDPWIVAVDMISEGVDIPRLRVGVYATTTTTELYWEQWRGRFTRRPQGEPENTPAYLYVPGDPRLSEHVRRAYEESRVSKVLKEQNQAEGGNRAEPVTMQSMYVALGSAPQGIVSQFGELPLPLLAPTPVEGSAPVLSDEKETVRRRLKGLVGAVSNTFSVDIPLVHATLNQKCGGKIKDATLAQLLKREKICKGWLASHTYDGIRGFQKR
jgi:superfamily II DNA or RNA helicase